MTDGMKIALVGVLGMIVGAFLNAWLDFRPFEGIARVHVARPENGRVKFDVKCLGTNVQLGEVVPECNSGDCDFKNLTRTASTYAGDIPFDVAKPIAWNVRVKCE